MPQLKSLPSGRGAQILNSVQSSGPARIQQKPINPFPQQSVDVAQLETVRGVADAVSTDAGRTSVMDELDADAKKDPGDLAGLSTGVSESGMGLYGATDEFVGAVSSSDSDLSADNLEWDKGRKRSESEQDAWREDKGHSDADLRDMRRDDAVKGAVTASMGTAISFLGVPSLVRKLRGAENNYERFEQVLEGASTTAGAVATGAKISDAAQGGGHGNSEATSAISGYTGGIIDLVKSGYKSFMSLKGAYEEYQMVKNLPGSDPSAKEGAQIAFQSSVSMAQGVLSSINAYQKSFGSVISPGVVTAIPALGIVLGVISLFEKVMSLIQQGGLDLEAATEATHSDTILARGEVAEEHVAEVKEVLSSSDFLNYIKARAQAKQQLRDNPKIVREYEAALGNEDLKKRLQKRYPESYFRIEQAYELDREDYHDNFWTDKIMAFGVTASTIDSIIQDQTLLSHLDELKDKRTKSAGIGIFLDLVNLGADIATLTGTGAAVGSAMKAGTAAVGAARSGGNAIKFAARGKGAEDFASGATGKGFGRSMLDRTDILKSDSAKRERYFNSSRMILNKIADHDEFAASRLSPTEEERATVQSSYNRVATMVTGTGASITVIKAMAHSDAKSGNDIVKYIMEKMKSR